MPSAASFRLVQRSGMLRLGQLATPHGPVDTPGFMPVGTQATVKAVTPAQLDEVGAQMILANTYHLLLRPGPDVIEHAGGLHRFMGWPGPILTDSGGFQVYSLARIRSIREEGVEFQSHLDGSRQWLDPEKSVRVQEQLGADVAMVFDECIPYPSSYEYTREATERSLRWSERSLRAHQRQDQALWGIVQGGVFDDLRERSARGLVELGFAGYGIGGLSVGEPRELMLASLEETVPHLPAETPRYLMGVGTPLDFVACVERGIDLFDCVMPTRTARNATLFTAQGRINIKRREYADDHGPVDPACDCYVCRTFSRAYLRHLNLAKEMLAGVLGTIHNVAFFLNFMRDLRAAIAGGTWEAFRERQLAVWGGGDAGEE